MSKRSDVRYEMAVARSLGLLSRTFKHFYHKKPADFMLKSMLGIRETDNRFDDIIKALSYSTVDDAELEFKARLAKYNNTTQYPIGVTCKN